MYHDPIVGGQVPALSVDPEHQGHAVGRKLADALLGYFKEEGAKSVRTLVGTDMKDIASFFEKVGFRPGNIQLLEKTL